MQFVFAAAQVRGRGLRFHDALVGIYLAHGHSLSVFIEKATEFLQYLMGLGLVAVVCVALHVMTPRIGAVQPVGIISEKPVLHDIVDDIEAEAVHAQIEPVSYVA